jgi:hypothetical protein
MASNLDVVDKVHDDEEKVEEDPSATIPPEGGGEVVEKGRPCPVGHRWL